MKVSVLNLQEKQTQYWFSYFQITCKFLNSFMTDLFHSIVEDVGIMISRLLY